MGIFITMKILFITLCATPYEPCSLLQHGLLVRAACIEADCKDTSANSRKLQWACSLYDGMVKVRILWWMEVRVLSAELSSGHFGAGFSSLQDTVSGPPLLPAQPCLQTSEPRSCAFHLIRDESLRSFWPPLKITEKPVLSACSASTNTWTLQICGVIATGSQLFVLNTLWSLIMASLFSKETQQQCSLYVSRNPSKQDYIYIECRPSETCAMVIHRDLWNSID